MRISSPAAPVSIGSALLRHLISDTDHEFLNFDKLTYAGNLSTVSEVAGSNRYCFVQGDICDAASGARCDCRVPARRDYAPRRGEPRRPLD